MKYSSSHSALVYSKALFAVACPSSGTTGPADKIVCKLPKSSSVMLSWAHKLTQSGRKIHWKFKYQFWISRYTKMNKYLFSVLYADCNHVFVTKANNIAAEQCGKLNKLNIFLNATSLPAWAVLLGLSLALPRCWDVPNRTDLKRVAALTACQPTDTAQGDFVTYPDKCSYVHSMRGRNAKITYKSCIYFH